MSFYQTLQQATASEREHLFNAPIIEACRKGEISRDIYLRFLSQAYYHVRHTVPLLMATGGKLGQEYEWVRGAIAEYIDEEYGHQEWILSDIRACGGDAEAVRHGQPELPIELIVGVIGSILFVGLLLYRLRHGRKAVRLGKAAKKTGGAA